MEITKPCVYHYLFSHIPSYESEDEAKETATDLVFRLKTDLRLKEDKTQQLRLISPEVTLLSFYADEETETYLSQILFHDLITTILIYNHTGMHEEPLSFLGHRHDASFPDVPDQIGETSVFFAKAQPNAETVKQIAEIVGETQISEPFLCCQFEWGMLYALRHSFSLRDSLRTEKYVLLVPREEDLMKGDRFLSYSFHILESIRYKLFFEKQEARKCKTSNVNYEREISRLIDNVSKTLSGTTKPSSFEDELRQLDTQQAALYQSIARTDDILLTLEINMENLQNSLAAIPLTDDMLFSPLIKEFHFIRRQIKYDLKYIDHFLLSMNKYEEHLRLKIEWQRKEVEKRNNKIREFTNALIFSFGVALGVGQILTTLDWIGKFWAMLLSGSVAFAFNRFLGMERVKAIWDAFSWPGKIEKGLKGSP
ncbi:MAG: hypothetical protein JXI43_14585 [Tissierellales bacterium]|nr:hypothetical protein [Tissierellales bacterium]